MKKNGQCSLFLLELFVNVAVKLDIHTFIVEKVCCRHHRLENTCKRLVLTRARGSTFVMYSQIRLIKQKRHIDFLAGGC